MNNRIPRGRHPLSLISGAMGILYGVIFSQAFVALLASEKPKLVTKERRIVGVCVTETGTILRRERRAQPWQVVAKGETLLEKDFLLGLPGAMVDSANGAVRLNLLSDLSGSSPYPVKENAIQLDWNPDVDFDFVLDRGRVDLVNQKNGPAKVRVHVREDSWDLTLIEPGDSIALELYGRWPRGVPFSRNPGPKDQPTASLVFIILKGRVNLKYDSFEHVMTAPPGPAMMEWDNVTGLDESPHFLEKLPPWALADEENNPEVKEKKTALEDFRQQLLKHSVNEALEDLMKSPNPTNRARAVMIMGALDDLKGLGNALKEEKNSEVWENGVLALRRWIGRGPGQDQLLYKGLVEKANFSPVQAETILQLLHSFGDTDLTNPEVYQTLIDYLGHDKLAIRGLAYWHLRRLVPAGEKFGYNPQDSKEARDAAIRKWRKLIPEGKVPSRSKITKEPD